jgi:hypothetical protein
MLKTTTAPPLAAPGLLRKTDIDRRNKNFYGVDFHFNRPV